MGGKRILQNSREQIIALRHRGFSYSEIRKKFNVGKSTLSLMLRDLKLDNDALNVLVAKKFKSKGMAEQEWNEARVWAKSQIGVVDQRDKMLILAMLYWGEGTKRELSIINGDPALLQVFLNCLRGMGINENDITIAIRMFDRSRANDAVRFWTEALKVSRTSVMRFEFIEGKKEGRMPYGMCRIRIRKGSLYFKRIMSMISEVKDLFSRRSSMDRTRSS